MNCVVNGHFVGKPRLEPKLIYQNWSRGGRQLMFESRKEVEETEVMNRLQDHDIIESSHI